MSILVAQNAHAVCRRFLYNIVRLKSIEQSGYFFFHSSERTVIEFMILCFLWFLFYCSLVNLRDITIPTKVNSASLHPEKNVFVCGGEDLKMYKFDYASGNEIGESS